jgi:2-polyprenyl-3-methyl-5-hydroxy-6-metoxy-1,4-benzoquinol methylase
MATSPQDSQAFYDALAPTYDTMIDFRTRLAPASAWMQRLLAERPVRRALDLATGTGLYALALAQAGVATTGSDLAPAMLEQAARRAAELGLTLDWLAAPMEAVAGRLPPGYDLVLCLGNSLPHLLTDEQLERFAAGAAALLAPGGRLVVQWLNYDRVCAQQQRIVAITRAGEQEFVRFYDFLPDGQLRFNVLRVDWAGGRATHALESVLLRPWRPAQVATVLARHGLVAAPLAANPQGAPFEPARSESLILTATRP